VRAAEEEDRQLMQRAAAGDRAAFETLAAKHGRALLRLTRAIAGEAQGDDAAQEALLQAFRRAATYRPELGPVRPWLFAIARREAWHARAREVATQVEEQASEAPLVELGVSAGWSSEDPEATLARAEDAEALWWALAGLPAKDREVLLLRDVEGASGDETAAILELDLPGMKSRLHRARLKLMASLREGSTALAAQNRSAGGLDCAQVLGRLSEYVDGQLAAAEVEKVNAHLKGCEVCERFGGRFKRTVAGLRQQLGAAPAVDAATVERLMRRWRPPQS
jgi:RNA polymerase sigma-70 factor, ECF subfamily